MDDIDLQLPDDLLAQMYADWPRSSSDELLFPQWDLVFEDLLPTDMILSEETHPVSSSQLPESIFVTDIPTDLKEWQVIDIHTQRQRPPRLLEFLILLLEKSHYEPYASYTNRAEGVFHIHQPEKVAQLWEQVKNRHSKQRMTYDKFARAIRWFYKTDTMKKTNTRYTFQFSPKILSASNIDLNNNTLTSISCTDE